MAIHKQGARRKLVTGCKQRLLASGIAASLMAILATTAATASARAADQVTQIAQRTADPGSAVGVAPSTTNDSFMRCGLDEQLVGGGALGEKNTTTPAGDVLLVSAPDGNHALSWSARAYNTDSSVSHNLTAYAYCASGGGPDQVASIAQRTGTPVAVSGGATGDAFASCQPGEQLVGGGARGEDTPYRGNELMISAPDPNSALRWFARATNFDSVSHNLTAYAYCASGGGPDQVASIAKRTGTPVAVEGGAVGDAFASCQPGEQLVGGGALGETADTGFAPSGDELMISAPDPNNALGWLARAHNADNSLSNPYNYLTAYAFCASPPPPPPNAGGSTSGPTGLQATALKKCKHKHGKKRKKCKKKAHLLPV